jgi:hypothetical protein
MSRTQILMRERLGRYPSQHSRSGISGRERERQQQPFVALGGVHAQARGRFLGRGAPARNARGREQRGGIAREAQA